DFIEKVASESNKRFASAGPLIWDATRTDSQDLIANQASFSHWINAVAALCKDKVFAGLHLKMESPGVVESRATAAAKAQNHLLWQLEMPVHPGAETKEPPINSTKMSLIASVFEDSVNLYIEKLYKEHLPNKKYINQFPVFIDPCDSNQYILLTIGAMQTWAHSLNLGTPGVLINSPPAPLCYLNLNSKKRRPSSSSSSTSEMGKILLELLANKKKQSVPSSDLDGDDSSGVQSGTTTMGDYFDFIK
ncbi:uncharacterized protein VP01_8856g1, partial [Puccinia sorghi]